MLSQKKFKFEKSAYEWTETRREVCAVISSLRLVFVSCSCNAFIVYIIDKRSKTETSESFHYIYSGTKLNRN